MKTLKIKLKNALPFPSNDISKDHFHTRYRDTAACPTKETIYGMLEYVFGHSGEHKAGENMNWRNIKA